MNGKASVDDNPATDQKGPEAQVLDAQGKPVDAKGQPVKPGAGANASEPEQPQKKRRVLLIALVVLTIGVLVGLYFWLESRGKESTDDAQIDGHFTAISPRVGGTVTKVYIEDNQQVKAGQLLFEIDPKDYEVALKRAQADLADAQAAAAGAQTNVPVTRTTASSGLSNAQAGLVQAQAGVGSAESQVGQAEARVATQRAKVAEARANYDRAERDRERYKLLVDKDEISKQQYDAAVAQAAAMLATVQSNEASLREAEASVATARSNVNEARGRVASAQAEVNNASTVPQQVQIQRTRAESAQAKVEQAQAAVKRAELDLSYTKVYAPVDGLVGNKRVEMGQVVAANQQLLTVVPLNDIWVTANFKETQLRKVRPNQEVEIKVDAYGRSYKGYVESIAPATGARFSLLPPENATGNYVKVVQRIPVRIRFNKDQDPEHMLRPGMSVEPTVILK